MTLGCQILESLQYTSHGFSNPVDCLQAYRDNPGRYQAIITDFSMPRMDGLAFAKEIWAINDQVPIILCTGFSDTVDQTNALSLGLADYLTKPIQKSDISEALAKIFAHS